MALNKNSQASHFFTSKNEARKRMNELGSKKTPFLFIINYDQTNHYIIPFDEIDSQQYLFNINGISNQASTNAESIHFQSPPSRENLIWRTSPITFNQYAKSFKPLLQELKNDSLSLVNLTFPTPIELNCSLKALFPLTQAKYRLCLDEQFISFSPETFITIKEGIISTYPMKGTIDATFPDAKGQLLNNPKEQKEHAIIVELAKKELNAMADNVSVTRYRYIEHVETNNGSILQSSSEISGELTPNYPDIIGDLIYQLLPAGSITGSPKKIAIDAIKYYENYSRNFYTGVAGYFDGKNMDSFVLIRMIERHDNQLYFKSGGGLTKESNIQDEYNELIKKVYLPLH